MAPKVEAVLLDLTGTLYIEDTAIPGSLEALKRLRASGVKIKVVSNSTTICMRTLQEKLLKLGFDFKKEEIYSALAASIDLVKRRKLRPYLIVETDTLEDFRGIDTSDPNAVVMGLAPDSFGYEHLDKAFRLMLGGAPLIAMFKTRYYPRTDGSIHLGPGAYVVGLEYATDSKAEVVGKPEKSFFLEAIKDLGVLPENTIMVGDDVHDDVEGSMKAGIRGVLVKTGKYRPGDEDKISPAPSMVFEDFPAVVDYVLSQQ